MEIRRLTGHDLPLISKLLQVCFPIKSSNVPAMLHWKYFGRKCDWIAYGALDKEELVSYYCDLSLPIGYGGNELSSTLCLDMATHPDYRGQGLISHLSREVYREVVNRNYQFSFGFSNEQGVQVDKHAHDYGYVVVGEFATYRKWQWHEKKTDITVVQTDTFMELPPISTRMFTLSPTSEYYRWRYREKPECRFEILSFYAHGELLTQAVSRVHEHTVDMLALRFSDDLLNLSHFCQIISAYTNYYQTQKITTCTLSVLQNNFWDASLAKSGFMRLPWKHTKYYLTVKIHTCPSREQLIDKQNWFLCGGDIL